MAHAFSHPIHTHQSHEPLARILLVDDDPALLTALPDMLQLRLPWIRVDTAESGEAGLQRIASSRYDLVITDLRMPGMNGVALTREVHRRWPGLPILMLTGAGDLAHAQAAVRAGAYGFLEKPVQRDSFVMRVRQALERHRRHGEADAPTIEQFNDRLSQCQEAWHKAFEEHWKLLRLRTEVFSDGKTADLWLGLAARHASLVQHQIQLTKQLLNWYRVREARRQEGLRLKHQGETVLTSARKRLQVRSDRPTS